ncbi:hypothetical protein P6144_01325 [Sphingomonas sp. HITSZ_GF]|nr:hypothetical protein [Sphingomonas sp. HITSZ_GF]MDG2532276.1 hypothetical protein [Sphingomonas sp. HITSZ_GF]
MVIAFNPVRPELVEGLSFSSPVGAKEERRFDKLSANGEVK